MICPSCYKKCPDEATFCGFCGKEIKRSGNGYRSDWAATVIDHDIRAKSSPLVEAKSSPSLDAKTDPWQRPQPTAARGAAGSGWGAENPLHDTVPNFAIQTIIAPSEELAAAVAETRQKPEEKPVAAAFDAATPVASPAHAIPTDPEGDAAHGATAALPAIAPHSAAKVVVLGETLPERDSAPSDSTAPRAEEVAKTAIAETGVESEAAATDTAEAAATKKAEREAAAAAKKAEKEAAAAAKKAAKAAKKAAKQTAKAGAVLPARRLMRLLMVAVGLGLLGIFVTPWLQSGFPADLGAALGQMGFAGLYPAAAAILLVVAAVLPLPYTLRALVGAALGGVALALTNFFDWRVIVTQTAIVLLAAALLHRARHRRSILARIMVLLGVGGLVSTLLVPAGGTVPIAQMIAAAGASPSLDKVAPQIYPLVLLPLCAFCLLTVIIGRKRSGLSRLWAFLLLLFTPAALWLGVAVSTYTIDDALSSQLPRLLEGLATLFFVSLTAYGTSQLLWKISGAGKQQATSSAGKDEESSADVEPPVAPPPAGPMRPARSVGA